jgi:hypothetical protein
MRRLLSLTTMTGRSWWALVIGLMTDECAGKAPKLFLARTLTMSPEEAADPEKRLSHLERCHLRNGLESKLKPAESPSVVRPTFLLSGVA